jgi:hypothetical protein
MPSALSENPNNLPLDVALVIEENSSTPPSVQRDDAPDTIENLVARLTAIRERLFWLAACWATTLSPDIAREADRYRDLFHDVAEQLRKQDPEKVDALITGHEALLLAEPSSKPTLPSRWQQWFELAGEVRGERSQLPRPKPPGYVPDGLSSFV